MTEDTGVRISVNELSKKEAFTLCYENNNIAQTAIGGNAGVFPLPISYPFTPKRRQVISRVSQLHTMESSILIVIGTPWLTPN